MNKGVFGFVGFVLGAAAGSLISWKLLEKKYADIADAEIESVKMAYSRNTAKPEKEDTSAEESPDNKFEEKDYAMNSTLSSSYTSPDDRPDYTAYSTAKGVEEHEDKPYVISPEEFGEFEDYEKIELTYYANKVLTDDMNEIVDDPDKIVGIESLSHFGEYEDDSVFVRNDRLKCDYQILLDPEEFSEVV